MNKSTEAWQAIAALILTLALIPIRVYVFSWLWFWFVVPLGMPTINGWHAFGIVATLGLTKDISQRNGEVKRTGEELFYNALSLIGGHLLILGLGYLVSGMI